MMQVSITHHKTGSSLLEYYCCIARHLQTVECHLSGSQFLQLDQLSYRRSVHLVTKEKTYYCFN